MDSLDLLAREDEYKKLNKQLEKKTESLMKEIENVMQKQDFFSDFSHSLIFNRNQSVTKHCCDSPKVSTPEKNVQKPARQKKTTSKSPENTAKHTDSFENENKICAITHVKDDCTNNCSNCVNNCTSYVNNCTNVANDCTSVANSCTKRVVCDCCTETRSRSDVEFLQAFISVGVQEKVLPQSFLKDKITIESVCKFLSSKVKLMEEQMNKQQTIIDNKTAQCKSHLTHLAELESERMMLISKTNNCKAVASDMKAKCGVLENKLSEKDRLYKEQRSEADKLASEVKKLRSKNASVEARCASQEETIDNMKQQLETTKRQEKEYRDSTRSLSASHQNAICRLEARIKSLTSCIDKQTALIDNLRKQNALLSTEGALKILERDYCNFLTQDM